MIKNTKIQNIIDIIKNLKSMGPNECNHKFFLMKIIIQMFLMILKKIDGPNKIKA
jgi:hypothetical protein